MTNKLLAGLIGILTLLAGLGGGVKLSEDDFDRAYVCPLTEQVAVLDRLSSTGKTGYYKEDNIEKQLQCRSGTIFDAWIPLKQYAEMKNINPVDLIRLSGMPSGKIWECDLNDCVLKENNK